MTGRVEKVRPGGAGRPMVEDARAMRAHAIVMPPPPRTGTTPFGEPVETVLAERQCRVIIDSDGASDA